MFIMAKAFAKVFIMDLKHLPWPCSLPWCKLELLTVAKAFRGVFAMALGLSVWPRVSP